MLREQLIILQPGCAALRNEKFFSLQELNEAIFTKLEEFNSKTFPKKEEKQIVSVFGRRKAISQAFTRFPLRTGSMVNCHGSI
mgnify:CR=1 FL=1